MANIKINYYQFHGIFVKEYKDSPFSLKGVGFEPEMLYLNSDRDAPYYECPSWKHRATRTFLIKCPIDIELVIDSQRAGMYSPNLDGEFFQQLTGATFVPGWHTPSRSTVQLSLPKFLFWTKEKNVWVDVRPHPETAIKNNLIALSAWYNMSNWIRPIGTAFDVVDSSKPIVIKRGDPLYQVSFYSKNLDKGIILTQKEPTEELMNRMEKMSLVKRYVKNISKNFLFKEQKSKCPVEFLWKK